jgi:hypothetical protein
MEIGELFAEKGEPPRYDRSASDNKGSRISQRLVPRPGDVSSGSIASFWPCADYFRSTPTSRQSESQSALHKTCQHETHAVQKTTFAQIIT